MWVYRNSRFPWNFDRAPASDHFAYRKCQNFSINAMSESTMFGLNLSPKVLFCMNTLVVCKLVASPSDVTSSGDSIAIEVTRRGPRQSVSFIRAGSNI